MKIKVNNIFKNKLFLKKDVKSTRVRRELTNKEKNDNEKSNKGEIIKNVDFKENVKNRNIDKIEKYDNNVIVYRRKGAINNVKKEKRYEEVNSDLNKKVEKKALKKSYVLLFFGMIILGTFSVYFAIKSYNKYEYEEYIVYSNIDESSISSNGNLQSDSTNNNDTNYIKEEVATVSLNVDTTNVASTTQKSSTKNTSTITTTTKVEPLSFSKPLAGNIQKIYSSDKVIYSKTLEMWKTHDGIDINASVGQIVKSIEKGVVEKVYDDSFYGKTVIIDHSQGYKSCYSNLDENVLVKEKQVVTKGTKIGKVGKTAIGEIKDDPHLHFTLIKNNEIIDPTYIFK